VRFQNLPGGYDALVEKYSQSNLISAHASDLSLDVNDFVISKLLTFSVVRKNLVRSDQFFITKSCVSYLLSDTKSIGTFQDLPSIKGHQYQE